MESPVLFKEQFPNLIEWNPLGAWLGCLVVWFLNTIYYALDLEYIQIPLELGAMWEYVFPKKVPSDCVAWPCPEIADSIPTV